MISPQFARADLVAIYRVGDGSGPLVNTGNAVFIDFYSTAGAFVGSTPLPSTAAGTANNLDLVSSGTATSEGLLTASPDRTQLAFTGYNAAVGGGTSLAGTAGTAVNRTVGVLTAGTAAPALYGFNDLATGNNPRSAVISGNNLYADGGAGGIRYANAGTLVPGSINNTSTQLSTTVVNLRASGIAGGQLYVSDSSGSAVRIGTVGSGQPTTAGQTITNLPGYLTNNSPYQFFFADLSAGVAGVDTLYVASDDATALSKWSLVAGTWTLNGTIGVAADAYRGLTGDIASGTVTLFATRKGGSGATGGGEFVTLTDASGYNGAFTGSPTVLATAQTNEAFRGIAISQVPEASAFLFGGLVCSVVGLSYYGRRLRRKNEGQALSA